MGGRTELRDAGGCTLLTYLPTRMDDRPAADESELTPGVDPREAAAAVLDQLPGWIIGGQGPLVDALLAAGCRQRRQAHSYTWDLTSNRPPALWAALQPGPRYRIDHADQHQAEDLLAAVGSAYPPEHPDYQTDQAEQLGDLRGILSGQLVGPLLPRSEVVLAGDHVVATLLLSNAPGQPPFGGPWVSDVFRHRDPAYAGLGSLLLRRALAGLASDGRSSLGLAVTEGNPARQVYDRLGFTLVSSGRTVFVPQ